MDIVELITDIYKLIKKSKFGEYLISMVTVNDNNYPDDSVDLTTESSDTVEKNIKNNKKGYKILFKKK